MMLNKKILIIGKTGQLGSELTNLFGPAAISPDFSELDVLRIRETEEYIGSIRPDIIINTSASNDLHKCEDAPYAAFAMNWTAVKNLALIAKRNAALFMHFSTNYVFDGAKKSPYAENDATNPLQIYGMSKLAGEDAIIRHYPDNSIIIRTSVLFGGEGSPEKGNFILNRIRDSKNKKLVVDAQQRFSVTYAVDLAAIVKRLIESKAEAGIYHAVNNGICSWFELTKYVFDSLHLDCTIEPTKMHGLDGKIRRPIFSPFSTEKIESLGIKPSFWKDAVTRYLEELREKGKIETLVLKP